MKSLFDYADMYLQKSDWKDLSLIKFCLFSMGILVGTGISDKKKGFAKTVATIVFAVTYVRIMSKFFEIIAEDSDQIIY